MRNPYDEDRTFYHSWTAGAWLPALQAALTGVFIGLAVFVAAWALSWPHPWRYGLITWAALQAVAWAWLLLRWLRLTAPIERALNVDLNGDGYIGDPEPQAEELPPPNVRIELAENNGRHTRIAELPVDQPRLIQLCAGLQRGAAFSEPTWTGAGRLFSRSEFRALRTEMVGRGMLEPASDKDYRQGYRLTPGGLAMVRYFASLALSPTLTQGNPEDN